MYYKILFTIENDFIPLGKVLYGTPQLSKSNIKLYSELMNFRTKGKSSSDDFVLQVINYFVYFSHTFTFYSMLLAVTK